MRKITLNGTEYFVDGEYPDGSYTMVLAHGWTQRENGEWIAPQTPEPPQPMTKYEFMQRMTAPERIQLARLRDTNAALPPDQKDYALADFFELWDLVQDVRTDNADTIAGITTIGTALGWSEERIGEILQA